MTERGLLAISLEYEGFFKLRALNNSYEHLQKKFSYKQLENVENVFAHHPMMSLYSAHKMKLKNSRILKNRLFISWKFPTFINVISLFLFLIM